VRLGTSKSANARLHQAMSEGTAPNPDQGQFGI
jgi:hypothetical protein